MRKGWREPGKNWGWLLLFLWGGRGLASGALDAPPAGVDAPVRVTVEVVWTASNSGESAAVELGLTEGQVVGAVAWPGPGRGEDAPERLADGYWRLGPDRGGRARARLETPLGATLMFRARGQVVRVPVLAVIEGPQHTPTQAPVEIAVERLSWDALTIGLPRGDGTVAPGSKVAVALGFNVLTADAADVNLKYTSELRPIRGGEPVWRDERIEVVASNRLDPASSVVNVTVPKIEGMYALDVRASWEPVTAREGSRFSRLIRRRRAPALSASVARRVALAVVGPGPAVAEEANSGRTDAVADAIDLSRLRGNRPSASGRAATATPGRSAWDVPQAAVVEATRRDLLRGWMTRAGAETSNLAPADASGLAWSAVGLKVARPGRPHRLTLTVTGGHPAALGVGVIDPSGAGGRPRLALDACASGPPILGDGPAATFSWLIWPEAAEPVLVLVNRGTAAPVHIGTVTLTELAQFPRGPNLVEPGPEAARTLGLDLSEPHALERFGLGAVSGGTETGPGDLFTLARRLAQYLDYCGATAAVLPEGLADRARRQALDGQAGEDAIGPDRLDLLPRLLARFGHPVWLDLTWDGPLPGLPAPDAPEARARGLSRVDRQGAPDGAVYHPLNPEVREALKRRVAEAVATRGLAGVLVRLGRGPTLLGGPDTGLDDATYARFVRETFDPETARGVPGLGAADPERFAARARFLTVSGRMPWLTWRARGIAALYAELAETARRAGGAALAVATPRLDDGPAGHEARRIDLAGQAPSLAWRAVGLDLDAWPTGDAAPIVLRGVGLSADDLAHDLATSPELDAKVAARPRRGVDLRGEEFAPVAKPTIAPGTGTGTGLSLSAPVPPDGPASDEPLGHALAALDARWAVLASALVTGREDQVRRFAQVFRALPAGPDAGAAGERLPSGVAYRALRQGGRTYLTLVNDTPYPVRLESVLTVPDATTIDDLGRGLRLSPRIEAGESHLVLDLPSFGAAAIRIGAPEARIASVTPFPSDAVLASMQARYDEISNQLTRLNQQAAGAGAPPNPGFEPNAGRPVVPLSLKTTPLPLNGWQAVGMANAVELDLTQVHSGQGSLRLDARELPAAAVSENFTPNVHSSLTVHAWLRADPPNTKLRLWIEGEANGAPFVRRSDLTVQPDWGLQAVRAAQLPPGGLETARLRFELLTTGSLWVDDLTVTGETLSEPERRNAKFALGAAMLAYREKRFADFARLSGSHWARHPALVVDAPAVARAPGGGPPRARESTALPSDRRLR